MSVQKKFAGSKRVGLPGTFSKDLQYNQFKLSTCARAAAVNKYVKEIVT